MINREELAKELLLREQIRKAIRVIVERRTAAQKKYDNDETHLREILRSLLQEKANTVANTAIHASTGINTLEDLLKNTNVLSVLSKGYKSLTTNADQRTSYKNHILRHVETSLAPEESRKESDEDIESVDVELQEVVDIDIADKPEDDPAFIDVDAERAAEPGEPDELEVFGIEGEDKTGRNKAFTDFKNVEKVILVAFDDLDDPEDREMFEDYLLKNLSLYFDKWEDELAANVTPPEEATDAQPDLEPGEVELEEVLNLDLENLVECLT